MKKAWCICGTLLFACCLFAQERSHLANPEKIQKLRTVYLKMKGPESSVAQLRTFFEKVAAKNDFVLANDPHNAGSTIDITIKEKNEEGTLFAELISATLTSREGKSALVYTCKAVTDGKSFSTITKKKGQTSLIPADIVKKGSVFIEAGTARTVDAVEMAKKEIGEAGFQFASAEKEADISLKDIHVIKKPFHGTGLQTRVESKISSHGGPMSNIATNFTSYTSIADPIAPEAEACRPSMQKLVDESVSFHQIAATDLALIGRPF